MGPKEVMKMYLKQILKYLFCFLITAMAFFTIHAANAQHEGGLGTKKVHLNIATTEQLMRIDGMTEDLAEAIVEYREKSGFFKKPEDLLNVPGVTKEVYEKLNPQKGPEGDLYCVPKEGTDEDEEEEPILSPSKC
jgi:competence ComEA-like helix-hairpin-helix protein